ncbi:hypothetical protein Nepgr_001392 [Nepenthes gracilis]|uniref:ENTH domain-containing protein n=1 Tax=Nepenthes gracilis TaxID=150966 RepID=A0AAD3RXJ4_NEPGR|nr:hypothetical protein Nepgr_001392 [Nepenthes gracilis]
MIWKRIIGIVKDHASISLAKFNSSSLSELDVAIIKATRHEECPAKDRHIKEIIILTSYSRHYVESCVNSISQRLSKTKNWVVATKSLMLIHQLLAEGNNAYEQVIFATKYGTQVLNLSNFRDTSEPNSWDYSAFVRTYALYIDKKLEHKMQGKKRKHNSFYSNKEDKKHDSGALEISLPAKKMKLEETMSNIQNLTQLLERFLATRPTGTAKRNLLVLIALYPIVNESFEIYRKITDLLSFLIDTFVELEVLECVKVHDICCRVSKRFDELDAYYVWCNEVGIARSSHYPEVERITSAKLRLMDEFIRDKAAILKAKRLAAIRSESEKNQNGEPEAVEEDWNNIKALPPPEGFSKGSAEEEKEEEPPPMKHDDDKTQQKEADLLHLGDDDASTGAEHGDKSALALLDGASATPKWEAFKDSPDWEMALVQSASNLPYQKASLGGGFDMMLLDSLYQQGAMKTGATSSASAGCAGNASGIAFGSEGHPPSQMPALAAPPLSSGMVNTVNADPFAASLWVAPPPYVQMRYMEQQQRLLVEQVMWQQGDGLQGQIGLTKYQTRQQNMGGYPLHDHGHGYGY